ncbi:holo-ACP synthase [Dellaglioa carnosa]|uniref:holo-ACP synthase n=1 Tax=Dellaglioa carnosa TaxID=2995136 RepID=UPI0022A82F1D|nr:holo-ACP synthase [Dellaglioa carnosa]MCZ2493009.1 holo-ACP synthase [Dellaglioa carnosa]
MIYGIGIDISDIKRVVEMANQHEQFITKILTTNEINQFNKLKGKHKDEFIAGRFSAKESYSKAFGTGIGNKVGFLDVEILNNEMGKPVIMKQPFDGNGFISISHTDSLVITEVILENKE